MGPIKLMNIHDRGGHFAGWENPKALAGDLCEMFGKGGGAYGVVEGKDGYSSSQTSTLPDRTK